MGQMDLLTEKAELTYPERPSVEQAEEAIRTLIRYIGDNPLREGLLETPDRVIRSYSELFRGYQEDPRDYLSKTFDETEGYDEVVLLRDIRVESYCEHHMLPIIGKAHVAYLPDKRVVGISKLARVVDGYSKRLQIQEKLTMQIAGAIDEVLKPKGTAVVIDATHGCMSCRGVHKQNVTMVTSRLTGAFRKNPDLRREFLSLLHNHTAQLI